MDSSTTVESLKEKVKKFIDERDWQQYHTLKNLSMDIAIESSELMELFVWAQGSECLSILESKRQEIENEVADIAFALLDFCISAHIDLSRAMEYKIALNAKKYPIEKSKGRSSKYTEL